MHAFELSCRNQNVGGPVVPARLIRGDSVEFQLREQLTFLVHGYNNSEKKASTALARFGAKLSSANSDSMVSVLWPGDHWTGAASFPWEGRDADLSAYELAKFIIVNAREDADLRFVSHSLGARVVMGAVDRLVRRNRRVSQICLMAAAVDADSLAASRVYRRATEWADRVAVLSSVQDDVLRVAYPAGDLLQAFLFLRDTPGFALGFRGSRRHKKEPVPEHVIDWRIDKKRKARHGHYLYDPQAKAAAKKNQLSAASYADAVLAGSADPKYP